MSCNSNYKFCLPPLTHTGEANMLKTLFITEKGSSRSEIAQTRGGETHC